MESGQDVNLSNGSGAEIWQSGLDSLPSQSDASSSYSALLSDQSQAVVREETYSPVYNMGDMQGYDAQTLSTLAVYGMCAGFAVSIGAALLSYAISAVMRVFKGITTE